MRRRRGILIVRHRRISLLTKQPDGLARFEQVFEDLTELPERLSKLFASMSKGKWDLIIAVPAEDTLSLTLTSQQLGKIEHRLSPSNIAFVLEEYLPWSAEDFTATIDSGESKSFALAIRTEHWRSVAAILRDLGHQVAGIVPVAILQGKAIDGSGLLGSREVAYLFHNDEGYHYLAFDRKGPKQWRFWPEAERPMEDLDQLIVAELSFRMSPDSTVGVDERLASLKDLLELKGVHVKSVPLGEQSDDGLLWAGANRHWQANNTSHDLMTGQLAATSLADQWKASLSMLAASCVILLLTSSAAFVWKAMQYKRLAEGMQQRQRDLYVETFPDSPVPRAVASRFDSQYRAIVGRRGAAEPVEFPVSVMNGLRGVLTAHQSPIRSRFEEIDIRSESVEIECEFRNHQDASAMVRRLEEAGLIVDTPQLRKLDDKRIGTRLRARLPGNETGDSQ